eukprot:gb/GECH01011516.1/.p1 GENE.gb/GECH01011516.1/~~gb/GECH01011516.1/.p1  ORF type:complete len:231 (+),score=62.84 gb/GECH01011516.1/:1-693(+)
MPKRWIPLESNPDVLNKFVWELGLPKEYAFTDVFSLDPEMLQFVPRPVYAVVLLFPVSETTEKARDEENEKIKKDGQTVSDNVYFMRQTVSNACGTVGVLHSIANNQDKFKLEGFCDKFIKETANLTPKERADYLENADDLEKAHQSTAQEGQTQAPSEDEKVSLHFISLVHVDGHLYELDGRKEFPINHGSTTQENLLDDAAGVVRKYMEYNPGNMNYTIMALTKRPSE